MTLTAERTYENKIVLNWEPDTYASVKIVRRLYGYPVDQYDGTVIYEGDGTLGTYEDSYELSDLSCYYYTLYYYDEVQADLCILREITGGEDEDSQSWHDEYFDTDVQVSSDSFEVQSNRSEVKLKQAGHYLVMWNIAFSAASTFGGTQHEGRLSVDSGSGHSPIVQGRGSGYQLGAASNNTVHGLATSFGIYKASAGDKIKLQMKNGTFIVTDNVTRDADRCGFQLMKLDDSLGYFEAIDDTGSQYFNSSAFTPFLWYTSTEKDNAYYTHTNGQSTIYLKTKGWHLVCFSMNFTVSSTAVPAAAINLNSSFVYHGSFQNFLSTPGAAHGSLSGIALVYNDTVGGTMYIGVSDQGTTGVTSVADECSINIMKLPDDAEIISVWDDLLDYDYDSDDNPHVWDGQIEVNTNSFIHSATSNQEDITVKKDAAYLFTFNGFAKKSTTGDLMNIYCDWVVNGTKQKYGGTGWYHQNSTTYYYGRASGMLFPALTAGQTINLYSSLINDGTSGPPRATKDWSGVAGWNLTQVNQAITTDPYNRAWVVYTEVGTDAYFERLQRIFPRTYFLRDEDVEDDPTTLRAILKAVIQPPLEEAEKLSAYYINLFDVDETPGPYLQPLASVIGIIPNLELSYMQQRSEIKAWAEALQWKGTAYALEIYTKAITGCETDVDPWSDNILITNNTNRIIPDLSDEENIVKVGFIGDPYSYVFDSQQSHDPSPGAGEVPYDPDTKYNTINFGLYIQLKPNLAFDDVLYKKVVRGAEYWAPLFTNAEIHLWDISYEQDLNDTWNDDHGGDT